MTSKKELRRRIHALELEILDLKVDMQVLANRVWDLRRPKIDSPSPWPLRPTTICHDGSRQVLTNTTVCDNLTQDPLFPIPRD